MANMSPGTTIRAAICGGLLLRVIWGISIPVVPFSDPAAYDAFARTLSEYGVFGFTRDQPFAFWPPGTTFLHGAIYWIFGPSYPAIVVFNIGLSLALIWSTARVAARFISSNASIFTAWVLASWPTLVMYVTVLASEIPFALFLILALDAWTTPGRSTLVRGLVAGVLLGMAALVRPLALALPVVFGASFAVSSFLAGKQWRHHVLSSLVALFAMAAVIAPWTLRNFNMYGEVILVSTNGGITFWMGNTPGTGGGWMPVPEDIGELPDNEQEKVLSARAWRYIQEEPAAFVRRTGQKLISLYANESIGVGWNAEGISQRLGEQWLTPLKRFTQITWGLLFVAGLLGLWVTIRSQGAWLVLLAPPAVTVAFFSIVYAVTVAQDRYHLSFAPLLAMFIGAGLHHIHSKTSGTLRKRA